MIIDGINVNYYDKGSGKETVLFLHGWGSEMSVFTGFLDGISGHYRACALNWPGFGGSDEPPCAWSVDDYADFILKFLNKMEINDVILIGHSYGGRIIIKLASRKNLPVNISKIILVDSAGIRPKKTIKQKARQTVYKAVRKVISTDMMQKACPDLLDKWRNRHGSADYLNASPIMRACLVKAVNEDLTPCLPMIPYPTLLVWGENDFDTPLSDAKTMERLMPDAGLAVLKNAGHYSFLEQSYMFGKILDSFLNIKR